MSLESFLKEHAAGRTDPGRPALADWVTACWFAIIPVVADTGQTQYYFNGGFTCLLTDDVQWEDGVEELILGAGLSVAIK